MKFFLTLALLLPGFLLVSCDRTGETGETAAAGDSATSAQSVADGEEIISIEEWRVPWDGRPRDPYVGPDGRIFFVGQQTHYVGIFDPQTGRFDRHDLEEGAGPHTVIVADDGMLWYAGNRARHIGKMDPETGEIHKFRMEEDYVRDPHTMDFDRNGNIWFTAQGGNGIGKLNVETGETTVIPVPTERARPYGIVMDNTKRQPWIVLFGTNKLATVDPGNMQLEEIELPRSETRPRRLAITSDGNIWYCDYATGQIGRYSPMTGEITEWPLPEGKDSRPYAMTRDHKNRLWVVTTGTSPNRFVGFDSVTEKFIASKEIESGGGTVRHMVFHEPEQAIWFGTDTNYLGRAIVN